MISIKVCKLSDLANKSIIMLISLICFIFAYKFVLRFIDKFSVDFIYFSINNNLCVRHDKNLIENMIFCNLPVYTVHDVKDDIENEFYFVENREKEIKKNVEVECEENINIKFNIANNSIEHTLPTLLDCEKISDSKYKIGLVNINDYTKKALNFDELEKALFTNLENDCKVLLYHTHTSESYTGAKEYSDSYRTEDNASNVVKVGETLKEELNKYGIFVRHDTTKHDYPSYNGAYKSSLKTVENILKSENYDIIIDIHRDALASNSQYRPTAEINGETVAKLMFVIGTNTAGLKHDNWVENLKFAVAVQHRANEVFPGLFRDLHLSTSRYNQHTSNKALILEVGATGNTIEEACLAMKYFALLLNSMR